MLNNMQNAGNGKIDAILVLDYLFRESHFNLSFHHNWIPEEYSTTN
jgi:hypothetical protein